MRKLNKKAAMEVQFNWIFVLIVGALIILFFVSVVNTVGKSSKKEISSTLNSRLKNIINQVSGDVENSRSVEMPGLTLQFECNNFEIKDSGNPQDIRYITLFSSDIIKGTELLAKTSSFEMPYPVDYFVYLTSKQIRYNFVNNNLNPQNKKLLNSLIKELPINSTYQIVTDSKDVINNNNFKEKFIFINENSNNILNADLSKLNSMKNNDITAINIIPSGDYGEINYYVKSDTTFISDPEYPSSAYLSFPMLVGAVISDASLYECNVNKAMLKFKILTTIYSNRTTSFYNHYKGATDASDRNCLGAYSSLDNLNDMVDAVNKPITKDNFMKISRQAENLETINNQALLNSCPMIY